MCHIWGTGDMHKKFWWGRPDGKRPLGRPRLRWEDNILELKELEWRGMAWNDLILG